METTQKPEEARITLRIPNDLHQDFKRLAQKRKRSLNAEFMYALEQYMNWHKKKEAKQE